MALNMDSRLPQAYLFFGIELDKLDRVDDAIAAFDNCLRLAPQMPNCHYYLGKLLGKKGESLYSSRARRSRCCAENEFPRRIRTSGLRGHRPIAFSNNSSASPAEPNCSSTFERNRYVHTSFGNSLLARTSTILAPPRSPLSNKICASSKK
jgi:hypothetical protein